MIPGRSPEPEPEPFGLDELLVPLPEPLRPEDADPPGRDADPEPELLLGPDVLPPDVEPPDCEPEEPLPALPA